MTNDKWRPVAALIDNLWKDEFDEAREAAFFAALAHYTAVEVQAAVLALAGRPGGAFSPSASEIAAEVHAQRYIGTWAWAMEVLRTLVREHFRDDPDFAVQLVNRRLQVVPDALTDSIAAVHPVYGPLVVDLIGERGLVRLWATTSSGWHEREHQRAWARLVTGTTDPVTQLAAPTAPTAIRPVH